MWDRVGVILAHPYKVGLRLIYRPDRPYICRGIARSPFLVHNGKQFELVILGHFYGESWLDFVLRDQVFAVASRCQHCGGSVIYLVGDFCHVDAAIKFEFDLEMVSAFNFDFLYRFDKDVRLSHVNHGHGEADVAINQTIVPIVEGLTLDWVWIDLEARSQVIDLSFFILDVSGTEQALVWVCGVMCFDLVESGANVRWSGLVVKVCVKSWLGLHYAFIDDCSASFDVPAGSVCPVDKLTLLCVACLDCIGEVVLLQSFRVLRSLPNNGYIASRAFQHCLTKSSKRFVVGCFLWYILSIVVLKATIDAAPRIWNDYVISTAFERSCCNEKVVVEQSIQGTTSYCV